MLRKLALVMAISPAIWLSTASALGLGEIDVQSKLNQRLSASIPLTDLAPDEADTLQVGLAQGDAYDKAGLTRSDYLNALSFTVVTDDGAPHIVISGKQIAREPLLNILLEVRGRNGRLQRAFTVLLDPPDYAMPKAPAAEEASTASEPVAPPKKAQKKSAETGAQASPSRTETGDYGPVAAGETLWSIASRLRSDPAITMDQMQLALYKANPKAFENGRIGSLLKGVTLKVPTEKTIKSVSPEKARLLVQQLRAGGQLQRSPSVKKSEVSKPVEEPQPTTAPPAAEPAPAPVAKPAEPPAPPPPPKPAPAVKPAETAPAVAAPAKTPAPAIKSVTPAASAVMSEPASAVAATAPASAAASVAPAMTEAASATAGSIAAASGVAAEPASAVRPQAVEPVKPYIPPPIPVQPEPAPAPLMEEFEGPIKLAGGVAVVAGLLGWVLLSRKKKAKTAPKAEPKVEPRKPFNWQFWKKAQPANAAPPMLKPGKKTPAVAMPTAAFDEAEFERDYEATQKSSGGKFPSETQKLEQTLSATDTAHLPNFDSTKIFDAPPDVNLSGINTDAVDFDVTGKFEAETLKIDLNSNDPVSEADFHLAYGLYDEAALQLKQAAQKQPNRTDIRTKLAEVYFRAGKAPEFQEVAEGLKPLLSQTEWTKVALMGKQLSPDSPLFQGVDANALATDVDMAFDEPSFAAAPAPAPVPAAKASAPAAMDFELTSLDLPKVEEPKSKPAAETSNSLEFNLDDFTLDTPTLKATPVVATAPAATAATTAATTAVDAPMEFDLSAFDVGTPDAASSTTKLASADEIKLDDFDLNMPEEGAAISTGDEASTKLDLARAYVDMGDNDMARSLLNEVLQQGSAVQKTEAQALLSRLG